MILTAIGIYSLNTKDEETTNIREDIKRLVMEHPHVIDMHGFYLDKDDKTIRFDVIVSFDAKDRLKAYYEILDKVQKAYSNYTVRMEIDRDFGV